MMEAMHHDAQDTSMRMAAFEHVRRLAEIQDHLTANELKPGFVFNGERIPLVNPQRGIFKPQQMRFLLSIKTVFPKPGGKVVRRPARGASADFRGRRNDRLRLHGSEPGCGRQSMAS
jgi:hypothetical protein